MSQLGHRRRRRRREEPSENGAWGGHDSPVTGTATGQDAVDQIAPEGRYTLDKRVRGIAEIESAQSPKAASNCRKSCAGHFFDRLRRPSGRTILFERWNSPPACDLNP